MDQTPNDDTTRTGTDTEGLLVAYFSSEFGLRSDLPIYAGGLGILAGDHLKAAADLRVPLVGVGLFYQGGYFRQELDRDGNQVERYPDLDPERLGLDLVCGEDGAPLRVDLDLAGERAAFQVWKLSVGPTVDLYLLDTDVEGNSPAARLVAGTLYGGDREHRLRQELVLGVGGVRALRACGLRPTVFHMNEGHAALLAIERLRILVSEEGLEPGEALERVRASTVFTTHTPVPAGNDVFEPDLVRRYLEPIVREAGFTIEDVFELARGFAGDPLFGMTPLALRTSAYANGVSALHGEVARDMWAALWPDRAAQEVPIGHVTNGVHPRTWLSPELQGALRWVGVRPDAHPDTQCWERARELDLEQLWLLRADYRRRLVEEVARRAGRQLDPQALTIGFARRFATYKRAGLLLSDAGRLGRLLGDPERPVQLLVAGKAHPLDEPGKEVLRQVVQFSRTPEAAGRVVFLEDYDMDLAAALVRGTDVWLNTPRRPLEASGTSGMKAGMNGGLNLSVLDGWWAEGATPEIGWSISGEGDPNELDRLDAEELFTLLETQVVPAFHERDDRGIPVRWASMMRAAIAEVGGRFNAQRMVCEYVEQYYLPAHRGAPEPAGVG
jgi:starch phosphorylase